MNRSFLFCAALLAGLFVLTAVAEPAKKTKSKSPSDHVTPKPQPNSSVPAKPRKASTTDPTPKPKSRASDDESTEKADPTPAPKSRAAKTLTPTPTPSEETPAKPPASTPGERAPAATLDPTELREFAEQPPRVQQLITAALELTKLNLTYTYGSADPANGGMDCSGTMYHLLRTQGFADVARDSGGQYAWSRKRGSFYAVVSKSAESFEFADLLPGDLLFWTGTYDVKREIPISHVMLYLGTEKKTKKRVMFGASDGRSYAGIQRWGVSVFDFKMPREGAAGSGGNNVDFVGYARIPGLRESAGLATAEPPTAHEEAVEKPVKKPEKTGATPAPKSAAKSSAKSGSSKSGATKGKTKSSSRSD